MPRTANHYVTKLKINPTTWKTPTNQDKIFIALLSDNIKMLKRNDMDINAFTVYGCHQQGATGFNKIMKGLPLTQDKYAKLRRNLPHKYRHFGNDRIRQVWIDYWKNRMS